MRVRRIQIERWRNLEAIDLELASDVDMVCLVGENGTGKSNLLELIATTAHHLGVTPGLALKRPHPRDRQEPFSVSVTLDVAGLVNAEAVSHQAPVLPLDSWDGSITFDAAGRLHEPGETAAPDLNVATSSTGLYTSWWLPLAGGLEDASQAMSLGHHIVSQLQQRPEVLHLYVDAERVFPPPNVRDEEVLALARQDTQAPGWVRQQAAVLSDNLYLQWLRQMLGAQQREQSRYYQLARDAESRGEQIPPPQDPLDDYAAAVGQVLPHLRFVRLDQERRQLIFDAAGIQLAYEDLSGGEREVAFLVGQIDRFGMRDGLFLVDEPELHLNAELLLAWLEYLRGTVDAGQVWIATHALEAVEVAGNAATLVCERDADDRVVRIVSPLGERPVLATLAGLLGAPGFSLVRSRFVLIEGDRPGRERERFVQLLEVPATDRFLESGGCGQVLARLAHVRAVATATEQLRIGAIIDRDMRSDAQVTAVEELGGFVLPGDGDREPVPVPDTRRGDRRPAWANGGDIADARPRPC